jgi:hypothetical protein
MLDALRGSFVYVVAVALVRLVQGDRREALMLLVAALLGACLYALLLG